MRQNHNVMQSPSTQSVITLLGIVTGTNRKHFHSVLLMNSKLSSSALSQLILMYGSCTRILMRKVVMHLWRTAGYCSFLENVGERNL